MIYKSYLSPLPQILVYGNFSEMFIPICETINAVTYYRSRNDIPCADIGLKKGIMCYISIQHYVRVDVHPDSATDNTGRKYD